MFNPSPPVLASTDARPPDDHAVLSFAVGPVQGWIAAARTVRDLWSGSMTLSHLTFRGLLPVVRAHGPDAVLFPVVTDLPPYRWHLRSGPQTGVDERRSPCLPNRFVALVPAAAAAGLAAECEQAARGAWKEIADAVRERLRDAWDDRFPGWDARWDTQIGGYFDIRTAVLPVADATREVLTRLLGPAAADGDTDWGRVMALAARAEAAAKAVRHFPPDTRADADVPGKCSLLGTFEQVGPARLRESDAFWEDVGAADRGTNIGGARLNARDRFCAVALAKRFAGPAYFAEHLGLASDELRFPDTSTVAAAEWLNRAGIVPDAVRQEHRDWNGLWLHWPTRDHDTKSAPECPREVFGRIQAKRKPKAEGGLGPLPAYFAVLMMDGDNMGEWLSGRRSTLRGRHLQTAVSQALARFAVHTVPGIVRQHHGTLIYAGGDDVLALLPTATALTCAKELRDAFVGERGLGAVPAKDGGKAGMSAGLAVVHHKEDLRYALQAARDAEKRAKNAGRDAVDLIVCRRSGEHKSAGLPWNFVGYLGEWVNEFRDGAGDRWAYHLRADQPTLAGLPPEAVRAEIRRQVGRSERPPADPDDIAGRFDDYRGAMASRGCQPPRALDGFLTLALAASFLARGRDD